MTVLALAAIPAYLKLKKAKKEKHELLPAVSADAVLASVSPERKQKPENETFIRLVAVVVGEHVVGAPVRLQGFCGVRVLRKIRFTSDERTILPLISLHLWI